MYQEPSTPDAAVIYLQQQRKLWDEQHKVRMGQWNYFDTEEYANEVTTYLLAQTHEDDEPPWLRNPTEGDDV